MWSVVVCLVACGLSPFCHPSARYRGLVADGYTPVPLTRIAGGNTYLVNCRFGDHHLKLMLDTGALSFAALQAPVAKRVGLAVTRQVKVQQFSDVCVAGAGFLPHLTVGTFPTDGGTVYVHESPHWSGEEFTKLLGVGLDGLLGFRCLDQYDGVIDYPTDTLFLRRPSQAGLAKLQGDWACVGFEREGVALPAEAAAVHKMRVVGDAAWIGDWSAANGPRLLLNDNRSPKRLSMWWQDKDGRYGTTGIYRLNGDELEICLVTEGRTAVAAREFRTAPGSGTQLIKYRRMPK